MKAKNIYIMLGIFAVLILIYVVQNTTSSRKQATEAFTDLSQGLVSQEITEVAIYRPAHEDSGLVLAKTGESWIVKSRFNAPAKQSEIDKLLSDLSSMKGELRGNDSNLEDDFGLAESSATFLVIKSGVDNVSLTFQLGKRGPDSRGAFIRKGGSPEMYLTQSNILSSFGMNTDNSQPDSKKWVETKIFNYTKDDLNKLKIISKNKSIELIAEEKKMDIGDQPGAIKGTKRDWKKGEISAGITVPDDQINSLVGKLVNSRATDVADPNGAGLYGFEGSDFKIEFADTSRVIHTFAVGKPTPDNANNYYARIQDGSVIFIINKSTFDNLFTTPFEKKK